MATTVPASEFTCNFGRYRMRAQRETIAVSSHSEITGYFIGAEELRRYRDSGHSFTTADLSAEKTVSIGASRMDARHAHLGTMLDQ